MRAKIIIYDEDDVVFFCGKEMELNEAIYCFKVLTKPSMFGTKSFRIVLETC